MAVSSVKEQIQKLVDMQKIDGEIYSHNKDLQEKPAYIQQLKENFENKKENLNALEENLKKLKVDRKAQELELKAKEEEIAKGNMQLSQIKTNKEYTAKLTEIETIKADMSRIEEKIIASYDEADAVNQDVEKEKAFLQEEEKKYNEEKKKVDDEVKIIKDKVAVLETKRKQILPEIDKEKLMRYEKILKHKEGSAIVPVKGSACGGCYMNVPAQVINEIKMYDKLIECEMCARILYLEEDL